MSYEIFGVGELRRYILTPEHLTPETFCNITHPCFMKTLKEVSIITGISVIVAFGVNYFSPNGIALVGQWDISQGVVSAVGKNDVVMDELEIDDLTHAKVTL